MIDVKGLTKHYQSLKAIDNLNFTIEKGEIVGFLGPNGAGKTTTMKLLTCFMPPTSGTATINNLSIIKDSMQIQSLIGYLPENNPLYTDMNVLQYLKFIADIRRIPQSTYQHAIDRVISLCELNSVLHQSIEACSKGFKQRVGLAQALIHKPKILILDEPTVGLDPNQIIEIRNLIKELGQDTTIILCSHILSEVAATCSNVFILKKGHIIAQGSPETLQKQNNLSYKILIELTAPLAELKASLEPLNLAIQTIKHQKKAASFFSYELSCDSDCRTALFELAVAKKWTVKELTLEKHSLEDTFIELTKDLS